MDHGRSVKQRWDLFLAASCSRVWRTRRASRPQASSASALRSIAGAQRTAPIRVDLAQQCPIDRPSAVHRRPAPGLDFASAAGGWSCSRSTMHHDRCRTARRSTCAHSPDLPPTLPTSGTSAREPGPNRSMPTPDHREWRRHSSASAACCGSARRAPWPGSSRDTGAWRPRRASSVGTIREELQEACARSGARGRSGAAWSCRIAATPPADRRRAASAQRGEASSALTSPRAASASQGGTPAWRARLPVRPPRTAAPPALPPQARRRGPLPKRQRLAHNAALGSVTA